MAETTVIPSGWVDKTEAEQILGKDIKTLQRWIAQGAVEVERQEIKTAGRKPIPVYKRADLERIKGQLSPAGPRPATQALVPAAAALSEWIMDALNPRLVKQLLQSGDPLLASAQAARASVPIAEKPLLTLEEAHAYTSIPKTHLEELRQDPKIARRFGRRWLYRREALQQL